MEKGTKTLHQASFICYNLAWVMFFMRQGILFFLSTSWLLLSCAHISSEKRSIASNKKTTANREPYSMKGDFQWLNRVQKDFDRIASETSSRTIAARKKDKLLIKHKNWSFFFSPENNIFYLRMGAASYTMVQPALMEDDYFSFVPKGEDANTMSLTIYKEGIEKNRRAASHEETCAVELSFWNKKTRKYEKNNLTIKNLRCSLIIDTVDNHIP